MGEELPPFVWEPVNPANISHLDIGNVIEMDQGLPNHRYKSIYGLFLMAQLLYTLFSTVFTYAKIKNYRLCS